MSNDNSKNANTSEAIILNTENTSSTLNDILGRENAKNSAINKDMGTLPTINRKIPENQPLSLNIMKKNIPNQTSQVIHVPQSIGSDNFNISINSSNELGTLDEAVQTTINRDLKLIYNKLKLVINPLISKEKKYNQIRQWDLWGPLLLNLILAFTLTLNTKEKGQITSLIFIIFWLGGTIIYLNNQFLGVKASIFQIFCLLGYCLFPLNIAAIIITIINFNDLIRLILVGGACGWSIYSSSDYLKVITNHEQRYLVLYPCILFYLYIAWFVFATKA
jgi:hypothetical protein